MTAKKSKKMTWKEISKKFDGLKRTDLIKMLNDVLESDEGWHRLNRNDLIKLCFLTFRIRNKEEVSKGNIVWFIKKSEVKKDVQQEEKMN